MKDIKDISGLKCELERQEQMARISKLQKEAKDEEASKDIKIVIGHELDEYSK